MPLPALTAVLLFRASVAEAGGVSVTAGAVDSIKDLVTGTSLALTGDTKASYAATGGPGGGPYLDFDRTGTRDYAANLPALQAALSGAAAPFHIVSVCYGYGDGDEPSCVLVAENPASNGFADRVTHYFNARDSQFLYVGVTIRGDAANGVQAEAGGFSANAWHVHESTYDGSAATARVDGGTPASVAVGGGALSGVSVTRIGARIGSGTKARQLRGRLAEVLVFDRVLSAQDRGSLLWYLNTTYGLAVPGAVQPASSVTGITRPWGAGPWGFAALGTWRQEYVGGRVAASLAASGMFFRSRITAGRAEGALAIQGGVRRLRTIGGQMQAQLGPRGGLRRTSVIRGQVQAFAAPRGGLSTVRVMGGRAGLSAEPRGGLFRSLTARGQVTAQAVLRGRLRNTWDRPATDLPTPAGWTAPGGTASPWTDHAGPTTPTWATRPPGEL